VLDEVDEVDELDEELLVELSDPPSEPDVELDEELELLPVDARLSVL
jgi:hypothetical protein